MPSCVPAPLALRTYRLRQPRQPRALELEKEAVVLASSRTRRQPKHVLAQLARRQTQSACAMPGTNLKRRSSFARMFGKRTR